ncbi:hypothetical protein Ancab_025930 [Ancistrocladus abbreviatus]
MKNPASSEPPQPAPVQGEEICWTGPEALPEETKDEASSQTKAQLQAVEDRCAPEWRSGKWRRVATSKQRNTEDLPSAQRVSSDLEP